jgi:hypothetical protein
VLRQAPRLLFHIKRGELLNRTLLRTDAKRDTVLKAEMIPFGLECFRLIVCKYT